MKNLTDLYSKSSTLLQLTVEKYVLYVKNIYDSREKPLPGKTSGVVIVWTAHRSTIFMVVVLLFSRL